MTRLEIALGAVLTAVLAGGAGYAVAQAVNPAPPAGHAVAAAHTPSPAPSRDPAGGSRMGSSPGGGSQPGMPSESATGFSDNQLAQSIARQTGTRLASDSPAYVSSSSAAALGGRLPGGAHADLGTNTITFTSRAVTFTVVAVPPGGPDMTFRIGGLVNPTLVLPSGATVHVEFINADTDQAHGWEVVGSGPPFEFGVGGPALAGALARPLGDPTTAGDGAETITFQAGRTGTYEYVCPMPGHAQMGMHGRVIVR